MKEHITRRSVLKLVAATAGTPVLVSEGVRAGGSFTDQYYDGRHYKRYVPGSYEGTKAVGLVVMLHGCSQSPQEFAAATQMNAVAESEGFIVVYPDQTRQANSSQCWNWFEPEHQQRGSGEPALIAGMTREVTNDFTVDSQRVYLAGFSAGGGMAPIMAVAYPDVYAAVGIHSGLEYDAANSLSEAFTAMASGGPNPQRQGTQGYEDMGPRAQIVRTIVFHGTDDYTVNPVNGHRAAEQATQTNDLAGDDSDDDDIDYTAETTETRTSPGHSYTINEYADGDGNIVVVKYMVDGMGHAWAGGAQGGSYTDSDAPNASRIMWGFFSNDGTDGSEDGNDDSNGDSGGDRNSAPTARVSVDSTAVTVNETVSFDGSGSSDSDGSIVGYNWDFGDGTTATGQTVSHSYDRAGEYTVSLTVSDDDGASATDRVTITVETESGYCGTTTNYRHGEAGRATQSASGAYYADGSSDYMGFPAEETTLEETSPEYYEVVQSCRVSSRLSFFFRPSTRALQ